MAKLTTNQAMARDASGKFTGSSQRALNRLIKYEAKIDARTQKQMEAVTAKLADNVIYSLKGAAYTVTQLAKALIVRTGRGKKGFARPGSPAHTRGMPSKNLKYAIWYEVDKVTQSAVIGPRAEFISDVGALHEFGRDRPSTPQRENYAKRPFMAPALARALPKIPAQFKNALVGPGS